MFEIIDFHKNVYIDGNILFDTQEKVKYCNIEAYTGYTKEQCDRFIEAKEKIVNGEKIICVGNDQINEDSAFYRVTGGATAYYGGIHVDNNPYHSAYSYNMNLLELNEIFELDVDSEKRKVINRMLYLTILSVYELFITEISVTCFKRFDDVATPIYSHPKIKTTSQKKAIEKLRSMSHYEILNLISDALLITIEPALLDEIKNVYKKRHDIAHRYKIAKKFDGYVIVKNEDIEELVKIVNRFVHTLFEDIVEAVY